MADLEELYRLGGRAGDDTTLHRGRRVTHEDGPEGAVAEFEDDGPVVGVDLDSRGDTNLAGGPRCALHRRVGRQDRH